MKGEGFAPAVKKGDTVKAGELLATVDFGAVRAAGSDTTIVAKRAGIQEQNVWDAAENGVSDLMETKDRESVNA